MQDVANEALGFRQRGFCYGYPHKETDNQIASSLISLRRRFHLFFDCFNLPSPSLCSRPRDRRSFGLEILKPHFESEHTVFASKSGNLYDIFCVSEL
ncbi:hypothetical protein Nepgr_008960 [Nepenthes gracilis]|uniref:Uncharacterized protein n=1 Tax=Nepenthes gracilis TaxID=150966 RepID=A0AAD3SA19_NEPGR|nr:hypothetical protein Nepgr_008960 [Nepenthes gracilis]